MAKRLVLFLLVGLNGLLLAALLLAGSGQSKAFGQMGARGGSYLTVTAKAAGQAYDVLYVLDGATQKLYAFTPGQPSKPQLTPAPPRDLRQDFGQP